MPTYKHEISNRGNFIRVSKYTKPTKISDAQERKISKLADQLYDEIVNDQSINEGTRFNLQRDGNKNGVDNH